MQLDINTLAIILAIVSLIITVIGFFASQRFYQDGVKLQTSANDTLVTIREKTGALEGHIGGISTKMLDIIGRREELSSDFKGLNEQIEQIPQVIETALTDIGAAGAEERARIAEIVNEQVSRVRQLVNQAQESAEAVSEWAVEEVARPVQLSSKPVSENYLKQLVTKVGSEYGPMSSREFLERLLEKDSKRLRVRDYLNALSHARERGLIEDDTDDIIRPPLPKP